jgi:hypothetical protein
MTFRNLIVFFLIICCSSACQELATKNYKSNSSIVENKRISRVLDFEYKGYDDTVYALIYGNIYQSEKTKNLSDTLKPLQNVSIKVEQNSKTVFTDTSGKFSLGLERGTFSLVITKAGYQTLRLTNYVSDPDQVSDTRIVLETGKDTAIYQIPKWTK